MPRTMLTPPRRALLALAATVTLGLTLPVYANPGDDAIRQALSDARQGNWSNISSSTASTHHVLDGYIEYHRLRQGLPEVSPARINAFIKTHSDSPISEWLRGAAQTAYGMAGDNTALLTVSDGEPEGALRQCYYYTALLSKDPAQAAAGGRKLWETGHSQPNQCDPLFNALRARGMLTNENDWNRLILAWESGNSSLVNYVRGSISDPAWQSALAAFNRVYADPSLVTSIPAQLGPNGNASGPLIVVAYEKLSRTAPSTALNTWRRMESRSSLTSEQRLTIVKSIAANTMLNQVDDNQAWVDSVLPQIGDDKLYELRIRSVLANRDWNSVYRLIPAMPTALRTDPHWQYWYARAAEQLGKRDEAQQAFRTSAQGRDFFAFSAADRLGRAYSMNDSTNPVSPARINAISAVPAVKRVDALYRINEAGLAYSEWLFMLKHSNHATKDAMAAYATTRHWYALAVAASISAKDMDALSWRFPRAYANNFVRWGNEYQVDPYLLMAISRRESAFNPAARSPVGARGLMQLMPGTAQLVARRQGLSYAGSESLTDPDTNIQMGSAYISSMLERFSGNRIAATAAYNAGPGRVNQWLSTQGKPFDLFVEGIPFRETRAYVQAVLAYRAIFESMAKGTSIGVQMLSIKERNANYGYSLMTE